MTVAVDLVTRTRTRAHELLRVGLVDDARLYEELAAAVIEAQEIATGEAMLADEAQTKVAALTQVAEAARDERRARLRMERWPIKDPAGYARIRAEWNQADDRLADGLAALVGLVGLHEQEQK